MNSDNRINPNDYRAKNAGARYRRRRKRKTTVIVLLVLLATIWAIIITLVVALAGQKGGEDGKLSFFESVLSVFKKKEETGAPSDTTAQGTTNTPAETTSDSGTTDGTAETQPPETGTKYIGLTAKTSGMYTGDLLLINGDHPFDFDGNSKLEAQCKSVWEVKRSTQTFSYKTANTTAKLRSDVITALNGLMNYFEQQTGRNDIQITQGHRTETAQAELYQWFVETYGATQAASYCALAGHSEHHTGLAFDCNIYSDIKQEGTFLSYNLDALDIDGDSGKSYYDWMSENAWRYGFIARYPANKTSKTGISYEPWHFRYVGKAHAYYMYSTGKCLEEYIAYIRAFTYSGEHLKVETDDGEIYEIYYIGVSAVTKPAVLSEDGTVISPEITEIPANTTLYVPADYQYEISGNNMDGFIITVKIK